MTDYRNLSMKSLDQDQKKSIYRNIKNVRGRKFKCK